MKISEAEHCHMVTYFVKYIIGDSLDVVVYTCYPPVTLALRIDAGSRSSHRRYSVRKGILRNFANSQENTCTRVSFLTKLLFFKKETLAQVFFCEFCEISKNTFFTEHLWTTASKVLTTEGKNH